MSSDVRANQKDYIANNKIESNIEKNWKSLLPFDFWGLLLFLLPVGVARLFCLGETEAHYSTGDVLLGIGIHHHGEAIRHLGLVRYTTQRIRLMCKNTWKNRKSKHTEGRGRTLIKLHHEDAFEHGHVRVHFFPRPSRFVGEWQRLLRTFGFLAAFFEFETK